MTKKKPETKGKPGEKKIEKEVEELKDKLADREKEAAEYLDILKRLKAEFENYKKRMVKEQTRMIEIASEELVLKVLPVLDNLERALNAARKNHDGEKLLKGIEMVDIQLKEVLKTEGLETIYPQGEPFDPEKHEAVMQAESDGHEEDSVIEVMQKGYQYKGKLLRPAMVKVCKKSEPEEECETHQPK